MYSFFFFLTLCRITILVFIDTASKKLHSAQNNHSLTIKKPFLFSFLMTKAQILETSRAFISKIGMWLSIYLININRV